MGAGEQGIAPAILRRFSQPKDGIGAFSRCRIQQKLAFRLLARVPGNKIDDAAKRRRTVKCRSDTLDHLNLTQIERRNLQNSDRADLSVKREAIRQQLSVSAAQSL